MLTDAQRAELEALGPENVRTKLPTHAGSGASISGFKCGDMTRGDIELWLGEKHALVTKQQDRILFWATVGGIGGIAGILGLAFAVVRWFAQK